MNDLKCLTAKVPQEPCCFTKHIGSTTYRVNINFKPDAKETLDVKILRLLKNDLQVLPGSAKMKPLQADWLSERGSQ
jgi:hypothetical protein